MPTFPSQPTHAPSQGFDMGAFLQWLQSQQQQTPQAPIDFGAQIAGIREAKDPQGAANRGYQPGVDNKYNPFSNGFFQPHSFPTSPAVGIPPRTDQESNPYSFGALGPAIPDASLIPPTRQVIPGLGGGIEGMINQGLPDAQRFADPNMFKVQPGVTSLPPGAVVGDGKTNYRRAKPTPPGVFGSSYWNNIR